MARQAREVPVENRGRWSIAEFAAVIGVSERWVRDQITWNDDHTVGELRLSHGVTVTVDTSVNGQAVIYRRWFDAAVDASPLVHVTYLTHEEVTA